MLLGMLMSRILVNSLQISFLQRCAEPLSFCQALSHNNLKLTLLASVPAKLKMNIHLHIHKVFLSVKKFTLQKIMHRVM